MTNVVGLRPYQRMADRKLLKLYVENCESALVADSLLTSEGLLQAEELLTRGYGVDDLAGLKKRLEK